MLSPLGSSPRGINAGYRGPKSECGSKKKSTAVGEEEGPEEGRIMKHGWW